MQRSTLPKEPTSSPRDVTAGLVLPITAVVFAVAIFAIDTFTPLGIAVAVLYVVVVLMAGRFLERRGVLLVSAACLALTISSHLLQHGFTAGPPFIRSLVSMLAIVITTFLALKTQLAASMLREQASLLEITHDAVIVRDMNDVIRFWNRGAEYLYGWPRDEAVGKVLYELLRTEFPAPLADIKTSLLRNDRWEGELVDTKRDGTEVVVASRWSVQRDNSGRPMAILETNNDVTKRKLAEAKTQQQEKELKLTIDTIPAFVWGNLTDGLTDYLNKRWLDYTGLTVEQAQGSGWQAVYHPDDLPRVIRTRTESLAAGKPYEHEARLRRADGVYRWFLNRSAPLRDERGNIVKWYGSNIDIEDRKQAEDALRRSEAFLTEAQKLSKTGSFGWDVATGKISWSDQAYRIFEYDRTVTPSLDLVIERSHPDDRRRVRRLIDSVSKDGRDWRIEHRLVMPNGAVKHVYCAAHPTSDASGRLEYAGALMDVTESKQAQEALHQVQSELAHVTRVTTLGELTASIAHEVNQPLAAIVTSGEATLRWLAKEPPFLAEAREALGRIIRDANRASEVVKRLRALAKKSDPQMAPLDINDVINDVVALVQREVTSHRVWLGLDLGESLPTTFGDRVQLQQVVINLVMNGIEAMAPVTERARELLISSRPHPDRRILVAVRDSGPGISAEAKDRLFTAFFTTKRDGMGMGLSICRSIIETHGGELSAVNNDGPGATFHFTVPIVEAAVS